MKKFLLIVMILSSAALAAVTAPTAGGKLKLGFDGTGVTLDGSNRVISWIDQVSDYDASVTLAEKRPYLKNVNTGNGIHPVLEFDNKYFLKTPAFASLFNQTNVIFVVAAKTASGVDYFCDGLSAANRNSFYTRSATPPHSYAMYSYNTQLINGNALEVVDPNNYQIFTAVFSGTSSMMRIDGVVKLSGNAGTGPLDGLTIGSDRNGNQCFRGRMAEVLVYDGGLNTEQILAVEDYLKYKYKIAASASIAKDPVPGNSDTVNPGTDLVLSWTAGDNALSHDVYYGQSSADVAAATIEDPRGVYMGNQTALSFPADNLEFGKRYYWRIDEVGSANVAAGDVWSFIVADYILLENFDSYADTSAMLAQWSAGGSGSVSLADDTAQLKTLSLSYSNSTAPYYCSASHTFSPAFDFTRMDAAALDLRIKGLSSNAAAPIYVSISDGTNTASLMIDASDIQNPAWAIKRLALSDFAGVNLAAVTSIKIAVGNSVNPGTATDGIVLVDEIRLYPKRCLGGYPAYDFTNDCVVDVADFAALAGDWLKSGLWPLER